MILFDLIEASAIAAATLSIMLLESLSASVEARDRGRALQIVSILINR
jgi:hypothetical protein